MIHDHHHHHHHSQRSLTKEAISATLHCLTGCAIGEVAGMIIATALDWGNVASIAISIILAFIFGYSLTMRSMLRAELSLRSALRAAFAADTASIALMELADNAFILAVPGAIDAGLNTALFWWSLGTSLIVAFLIALPLNRYLISKGKGHAVIHAYH